MIDLAALKAALEAAYQGDWSARTKWPDGTGGTEEIITAEPEDTRLCGSGYRTRVIVYMPNASDDEDNAAYIVATQPRVMRELIAEMERLRDAMRPFANAVFNDNGDVTLDLSNLRHVHWLAIRRAALAGDRHD